MADDARTSPTVARPALAQVLATVTDRPVGHWIAELRSPAFRGRWEIERYSGPRLCWHVETDFGRKTTARRSVPLTITDPAEALEAMVTRGVLPQSFAGDASRAWWCAICERRGLRATDARCAYGGGTAPSSILDLLAWASLGPAQIEQAEELAREAVRWLASWGVEKRDRRIVWRVAARTDDLNRFVWGDDEHRLHADGGVSHAMPHSEGGGRSWFVTNPLGWCSPATALWDMGLALDAIDGDALVLVCPPLGGSNA